MLAGIELAWCVPALAENVTGCSVICMAARKSSRFWSCGLVFMSQSAKNAAPPVSAGCSAVPGLSCSMPSLCLWIVVRSEDGSCHVQASPDV